MSAHRSLAFWVPLLIECAQIEAGHRVLDVGCGTGGFARAIAEMASPAVTGIDVSERFIAFVRCASAAAGYGRVEDRKRGSTARRRRLF
ncbi:MAG: class I SAM-dependent methyltransferase [Alphaproteobacteria bacterium]|nr:class I SAM-dependent methyltransferase [Alphaproteobacteria bacterium]